MIQSLRALVALSEDLGSIFSTHLVAQLSVTLVPGARIAFLAFEGTAHMWHTDIHECKDRVHIN